MNGRQAVRLLKRARRLIAAPDKWTKGTMARDAEDNPTFPDAAGAVKFCLLGALAHRADSGSYDARKLLTEKLRERSDFYFLSSFNDDAATKHSDVLALLDHTIASVS